MILEFRTKRDINGNCKYLAVDTDRQKYATHCRSYVGKDITTVRTSDIKLITETCRGAGYTYEDYL